MFCFFLSRSVKYLSLQGCCSINFNDFTLDKGQTNPNSLTTSKNSKCSVSVIDSNYEKRRNARNVKLQAKKKSKSKKWKKSKKSSKKKSSKKYNIKSKATIKREKEI